MPNFKLENNVPNYYVDESRDFQLLCRVLDIYLKGCLSKSSYIPYQLDLDKPLGDNVKGAKTIPTTTIITKNKIFIPIIDEMVDYFNVKQGVLKFMVRYDSVRNSNGEK